MKTDFKEVIAQIQKLPLIETFGQMHCNAFEIKKLVESNGWDYKDFQFEMEKQK